MSQDEVNRGERARELLENPLLVEAFAEVEKQILSQMRNAKFTDQVGHSQLIYAYQVFGKVRGALEQHVQTGKMARMELSKRGLI